MGTGDTAAVRSVLVLLRRLWGLAVARCARAVGWLVSLWVLRIGSRAD